MTAPTLRFEVGSTVAPGDRIGNVRQITPGIGTYARGGHVYASAVGRLTTLSSSSVVAGHDHLAPPIVSVQLSGKRQYASTQVLTVGQIVLGKVLRVVLQSAVIQIVAIKDVGALRNPHAEGAIRREDVRAGASQEVQLYDSVRPGDVVLCRILSLGDSRRYYLSTAEPELGVVRATCSTSGKRMVPISWKEMECPETKAKESRKCAKPKNLSAMLSSASS